MFQVMAKSHTKKKKKKKVWEVSRFSNIFPGLILRVKVDF